MAEQRAVINTALFSRNDPIKLTAIVDAGVLFDYSVVVDEDGAMYIATYGRGNKFAGVPFTPGVKPEFHNAASIDFDLSPDRRNPEYRPGPLYATGAIYDFDWEAGRWQKLAARCWVPRRSGMEYDIDVVRGTGAFSDKYLADIAGQVVLGTAEETAQRAYRRGLAWKHDVDQAQRKQAHDRARREALAVKLRGGGGVSGSELVFLGLHETSALRVFIPIAAGLFGIQSRNIRGHVADLISVETTEAGRQREVVPTRQALSVLADALSLGNRRLEQSEPSIIDRAELRARVGYRSTGAIRSGISVVRSLKDAAHIVAPIRKAAGEHFVALVLDRERRPIALVRAGLGDFRGVGVDPEVLLPSVASIKRASAVVFAHNHPSSSISPSDADIRMTMALESKTKLLGLEYLGHVIVAPGRRSAFAIERDVPWTRDAEDVGEIEIPALVRKVEIPVLESVFRRVNVDEGKVIGDMQTAIEVWADISGKRSGVVVLNVRMQCVGFIPLADDEMGRLQRSDTDGVLRVRNLASAVAQCNGSAFVVFAEGEEAGSNACAALANFGRVLNLVTIGRTAGVGGELALSVCGTGRVMAGDRFLRVPSAGSELPGVRLPEPILQAEIDRAMAAAPGLVFELLDSINDAPVSETTKAAYPHARAVTDGDARVWVFRNSPTVDDLRMTLAHEVVGHIGVERVLGDDWVAVVNMVQSLRDGSAACSLEMRAVLKEVDERYPSSRVDSLVLARETIAVMAERGVTGSLWDRIVVGVSRFLRTVWPSFVFPESELRDLLRKAAEAVQDGGPGQRRAIHCEIELADSGLSKSAVKGPGLIG